MKDRIADTQSSGNMSMNPPIEFDITVILKTTNKDICVKPAKDENQKHCPCLRFLLLTLSLCVFFLDDAIKHLLYMHTGESS